jgi:hypothetical protein
LQQCKAQIQELEQDPSEAKRRARGQETQEKQQKGPDSAKRARKKKRNQAEIRNKQQRTSRLSLPLPLALSSALLLHCRSLPVLSLVLMFSLSRSLVPSSPDQVPLFSVFCFFFVIYLFIHARGSVKSIGFSFSFSSPFLLPSEVGF